MREIWKYSIPLVYPATIALPRGAVLLSFQFQRGVPCMWAEVDQDAEVEPRRFMIRGAGRRYAPGDGDKFIGTAQDGPYVWHLFELGAKS